MNSDSNHFTFHTHFKDFMCIRMRKLHEEHQVPADAHDWYQTMFSFNIPKFVSKYLTAKNLSRCFGWSVRTLAMYIFARDHSLGISPVSIDCWNRWANTGPYLEACFFRTLGWSSSGPKAVDGFRPFWLPLQLKQQYHSWKEPTDLGAGLGCAHFCWTHP